jgi:hypothetical protein
LPYGYLSFDRLVDYLPTLTDQVSQPSTVSIGFRFIIVASNPGLQRAISVWRAMRVSERGSVTLEIWRQATGTALSLTNYDSSEAVNKKSKQD